MNKTLKSRVKYLLVISLTILLAFGSLLTVFLGGYSSASAAQDTGGWTSCPATVYEDATDNTAWTVFDTVSAGTTASASDKSYVKINSVSKSGAHVNYSEKISLDGKTVSFRLTNYGGNRIGFGLTESADGFSPSSGKFNAVLNRAWNWDNLYFQNDAHAEVTSGGPMTIAYKDENLTSDEFGTQSAKKYCMTINSTVEFSLKFEKLSNVYRITFDGNAFSPVTNVIYVSKNYIPDEAYICVFGYESGNPNVFIKAFEMKPTEGSHTTARYEEYSSLTHLYHIDHTWGDYSMHNSEKLALDGLELIFMANSLNNVENAHLSKDSCFAFTFTQDANADADALSSANKFTLSFWPYLDSSKEYASGLYFRNSHDYTSPAIASLTENGEVAANLNDNYDGNRYLFVDENIMNGNDEYVGYGKISFSVKFEKVNNSYKITTTLLTGTNYGLVTENSQTESFVCYVPASNFALDQDGKAYLAFYGFESDALVSAGYETDCYIGIVKAGTLPYIDRDDVLDPEMEYYDQETGEYIGSCFAGVSVHSIYVSIGVISAATLLFIIKRLLSRGK